ncbi:unnamed protein product [Callosobruchus maculatus]|uniref:Transmembrane protein n=1 Tax=Callosobruchus maculatus TaxID=64391 RepID=A0A653BVS2_CALMS|nr:unnamed protein product [Callosobruchus maculatus]
MPYCHCNIVFFLNWFFINVINYHYKKRQFKQRKIFVNEETSFLQKLEYIFIFFSCINVFYQYQSPRVYYKVQLFFLFFNSISFIVIIDLSQVIKRIGRSTNNVVNYYTIQYYFTYYLLYFLLYKRITCILF